MRKVLLVGAIALLGPARRGTRFTAYTDWTVSWRYDAVELVASQIDVHVTGTISLPCWTPLSSVSMELVARWQRLVEALRVIAIALRVIERPCSQTRARTRSACRPGSSP